MMKDEIPAVDRTQGSEGERLILRGRHICLLLLLFLTGISLGYQVRIPYEVRLGDPGDHSYIEGFYEPESNPSEVYRWSGAKAAIRLPGIGCPPNLTLRLRMNGARPEGRPLPYVALKVNGQELALIAAEGEMKIYEFPVPGEMVGWFGDMDLEIESETFSPTGGDRRELGVMVDWVMAIPRDKGVVIPSLLPLVSLALAGTIVCLPLRGKRVGKKAVFAPAIGISVAVGVLFAFHRIQAARWSWQLLLLVAAGYLGFIAWDGVLALRGVLGRIRRRTIAILLLALLVQLVLLAPQFDEGPNVWTDKNWVWHMKAHGLPSLYREAWATAQRIKPPVTLYIFNFIGWVYETMVSPIPPPLEEPTPSFGFLIRLPPVICNVILALVIYLWVESRKGSRWAHLAMAAFAFNPAIVLHATRLGHTDSVHSLLIVLSVIYATSGRQRLSWALITLAAGLKLQTLFLMPIVFVLTWQKSGPRGLLTGMLAGASTATIVMTPFIRTGTWKMVIGYFANLAGYELQSEPTVYNAHNLWWLIGLGKRFPDTNALWDLSLPLLGPLTYQAIGFSLFAIALLFALWRVAKIREDGWVWGVAAYVAFAFFMLPTKIQTNYMYTVFPLLAMGLFVSKSLLAIYVVLSGTWLLNLVLHDPIVVDSLGPDNAGIAMSTVVSTGRMLDALLNTVVLSHWTVLLIRMKGGDEVGHEKAPFLSMIGHQ